MKSRYAVIGLFGLWFLLILGSFFKYSLSVDPFFGTTRNVVNRYQKRGDIKDRQGEILAYGSGLARRYTLGAAGSPIIGVARPEIGVEGVIEREYGERLIGSRKSKLWYMLNQSNDGYPLKTTLDKDMQATAYHAMKNYSGAIVVMKLNGEVLASLSSPTYDPNKMNNKYYDRLKNHPERPLFNRAFDGRYEPGSAWKSAIAISLLEGNCRDKAVLCNGSLTVGNKVIRCMKAHGVVKNMADALTMSCNVWFMQTALAELDGEKMRKSFVRFMSRPLKEVMTPEDTALAAIGQGEVLVSPLELAQLAAAIGNKGMRPEPRLMKENIKLAKVIDEKIADKLSSMMSMVVKKGTAKGLAGFQKKGFFVAAKTGTAERDTPKGKINTAVLIGFAGASKNKPDFAFSVVIEDAPGYGGTVCVPVMKEILDFYFAKGQGK
ncbi:MAG: penicillin-binding transpeptidase domain-containing protein [Syntrophales bacterium]|nr:penicillin-binding transpeptidase domain-containing protein [Syntrophales bacterium]